MTTKVVQPTVSDALALQAVKALETAYPEWSEYPTKERFIKRGWSWGYQCDPLTPVIVWEEGPYDWAVIAANYPSGIEALKALGLWAEPGTGFALNLYRKED